MTAPDTTAASIPDQARGEHDQDQSAGKCTPGRYSVPGMMNATVRYTPGEGVWRDQRQVLDWCPIVTRHLVVLDSRGGIVGRRVTIDVDGRIATIALKDVADGTCWTERFPRAIGVGSRDVLTVLRNLVDDQAARLPLTPVFPYWEDDRLHLPPHDVLPPGYLQTAGTTAEFSALVRAVIQSPRIALVMGAAVGGLYVRPLGRQSFVVHLGGASSAGKSTTLACTAAIFGAPGHDGVVRPWSGTANSLPAALRTMGCLTAFRDELGASKGLVGEALGSLIFQVTQGAQRDQAARDAGFRPSQGSWHGCLVSSGNQSILDQVANEGIAARVIEPAEPLTSSADQAETLTPMAEKSYGHGLSAIAARSLPPGEFAEWADKAAVELDLPAGGVQRRIGQHLAMAVAGARLLGEIANVPGFAGAALAAARETLADLVASLAERGARPGDRLLAAVAGAFAANPGSWPTRQRYAEAAGSMYAPRDVYGYDLTGDPTYVGDVAVFQARLKEVAVAAGIESTNVALRDLDRRGLLKRSELKHDNNRAQLIKPLDGGKGKSVRAYVLTGVFTESDDQEGSTASAEGGNDFSEGPVTTLVTSPESAPDQEGNDFYDFSQGDVLEEVATNSNSAWSTSRPDQGKGGGPGPAGPCARCAAPGEACGMAYWHSTRGTCVICGALVAGYTWCGVPRHETCNGETPGEVIRSTTTNHATEAATDTPRRRFAAENTTAERYLLDAFPGSTRESRTAALELWHEAMRGIEFRGVFPTARGILGGALKHAKVPELPALDPAHLVDIFGDSSQRPVRWTSRTWLTGERAAVGEVIRAEDINAMYLSVAEMDLGTGKPTYMDGVPEGGLTRPGTKSTVLPGWVMYRSLPNGLPWGLDGRLRTDQWIPTPIASYLTDIGVPLDVSRSALWMTSRRWLRPHANLLRNARRIVMAAGGEIPGTPAEMAARMLKPVYARAFGGILRSERFNNGPTLRKDWAAMIEANGQARMFRSLDRIAARPVITRVLGIHVDAAWFALPAGSTYDQPGLRHGDHPYDGRCADCTKGGGWKPAGSAVVDQGVSEALRVGRWKPVHKAIANGQREQ